VIHRDNNDFLSIVPPKRLLEKLNAAAEEPHPH
jgi:hypothetical protein